jgi:hypothetical protein
VFVVPISEVAVDIHLWLHNQIANKPISQVAYTTLSKYLFLSMEEKSTAAVIVWTGGENMHGVIEKKSKISQSCQAAELPTTCISSI